MENITIGFEMREVIVNQNLKDVITLVDQSPDIDYLDMFSGSFDHISHDNNDRESQLATMQNIDRLIGSIWVAIGKSSRANETALVVVSDHGFTSTEDIYSQGFSLVRLFGGSAGGGHHIITKRWLMMDYSVKGIYPFTPLIRTNSKDSKYLKGMVDEYVTALVDFDGNERSTIHFRNSDLNVLHILLLELFTQKLDPKTKKAATDALFRVIEKNRVNWQTTVDELSVELAALNRRAERDELIVAGFPERLPQDALDLGIGHGNTRFAAHTRHSAGDVSRYGDYVASLKRLLALKPTDLDPKKLKIEDIIAQGAMGEQNSVSQLQDYVVGPGRRGLELSADGSLDFEKSFERINYFDLLLDQRVRNNTQIKIGDRPVDFIAKAHKVGTDSQLHRDDFGADDQVVWLNGGEKQGLS